MHNSILINSVKIRDEVKKSWDIFEKQGDGVVVDVLDSEIKFTSILKGKEYPLLSSQLISSSFVQSDLANLHGTAIAGLIAGDLDRLVCEQASKSDCDKDKKIVVAGIAPKAVIIGRAWYPTGSLYDALLDSMNELIPNDENGQPRRKVVRETKLILANISGGTGDTGIVEEIKRKASTKRDGDGNPYFLIVAAVGNDGVKLTGKKICSQGILPAKISRNYFVGKEIRDPIIRVGGTSKYASGTKPEIFHYPPEALWDKGSNYGEECVDILAPGEKIPVLSSLSKLEAMISNGTSDAAAITSGAIALLASCKPWATAEEIKQAILSNSDEYPKELGDKVYKGRVLNIYKAASNFCISPKKIKHKPKQPEEELHDEL